MGKDMILEIDNNNYEAWGGYRDGGEMVTSLYPKEWVRVAYGNNTIQWTFDDKTNETRINSAIILHQGSQVISRYALETLLGKSFMNSCDWELFEILNDKRIKDEENDNGN